MGNRLVCYVVAIAVILVWSTTFVATKVLLSALTPVEIMFYRYVLAYLVLLAAYPEFHRPVDVREEFLFAGAGFFGGTLYFLTENYALKHTLASNVGLLLAASPMLTALLARFFTERKKFGRNLWLGLVVAFAGVFLVIFNGHVVLGLRPFGDFLALGAAFSWALYSILIKKIGTRHAAAYTTRKVFFYSLLTMIPTLFFMDFRWDISILCDRITIGNLLFLGVIASSVCFLLWSKVIWRLGPVAVNNFIYLVPLFTMVFSTIALGEPVTIYAVAGGVLILSGVCLSSRGTLENSRASD